MKKLAIAAGLLLAASLAQADMYQDAGNAKLPEAPVNLGLGYAVKAGQSIQAALTAARGTGGAVTVAPGVYGINSPLLIGSNTHLKCQAGATIQANAAGWTGPLVPWNGGVDPVTAHIVNVNTAASAVTDENITIEGCNFVANGWAAGPLGSLHAISIRMARNVRIVGNRFTGLGNGTAMLATSGTTVDGNTMTDARNACWDHWEAPQNAVVTASNYCESSNIGGMATGGSTLGTGGIARHIRIGGTYRITGPALYSVGVWLNGISAAPATSGVEDAVIDHPIVFYDDISGGRTCIKISGGETRRVTVAGPTCRYGGIVVGNDEGGTVKGPIVLDAPLIDGVPASSSPVLIQNGSDLVTLQNARIRGGTYEWAVTVEPGATNTVVAGVLGIEAGSAGTFADGGTNSRVEGKGFSVATLPACNAANKSLVLSVADQLAAPTYRGTLTGGGTLAVLAYCNGTSWEAH